LEQLETGLGDGTMGEGTMEEEVLDLQVMLQALLKWWWMIALLTLFFSVAAYFYTSYTYVPQYTATATMVVNSKQAKVVNGQLVEVNDVALSKKLVDTYSIILRSDRVLEMVAGDLGIYLPLSFMYHSVSVANPKDTEVITVAVRDTDPGLAASVCNSIMKVAPEAIAGTVEVGSVNVVDYAEVPTHPGPPATVRNAAVGGLLGLMLGAGLALLFRYFDNTVKNDEDIRDKLGLAVLGCIPLLRKGRAAVPLAGAQGNGDGREVSSYRETFKIAGTKLHYAAHVHNSRKLLITSALKGEGKTTAALNLAVSLARGGKSVLVVNCDLRKTGNPKLLGLPIEEGKGLAQVLAGELEAADAVVTVEKAGISFMPAGAVVSNPSELLGSDGMAGLLARLEKDFDYILLDTPPACLFTDAVALSCYSDGVVFVIKQSCAKLDSIYLTLEHFRNVDALILGCILNEIKEKEAGYSYKYRDYERHLRLQAGRLEGIASPN
jgi:succinoglycan biosynthesis transport protein ExoP